MPRIFPAENRRIPPRKKAAAFSPFPEKKAAEIRVEWNTSAFRQRDIDTQLHHPVFKIGIYC